MTKTEQVYRDGLLHALRLRDVPGERIGEVLAEVESHLATTGEDPFQAFGTPKQYAADVADALAVPQPNWWAVNGWREGLHVLLITLCSAGGAWLLSDGIFGLVAGKVTLADLPPGLLLVAGVVLLAAVALHLVRHTRSRMSRVIDPRTGSVVPTPGARRALALLGAVPVALMLALAAVAYAIR